MEDPSPEAVDVVIVNYRSYDELGRCLASLEQGRSHFGQVTVIDHESDLDEASRIGQRFPWARVVECPTNEGFAAGVNVGARQTFSSYILLLNPDCVAHRDAVPRLVKFARTRPDAGAIGPRILALKLRQVPDLLPDPIPKPGEARAPAPEPAEPPKAGEGERRR